MASSDNLSTSIETWAFRPAFDNSWISEAFARETEALTKALQKSIATGVSSTTVDVSPYFLPNPETPSSQLQGQSVSSSSGGSETETVSKRATQKNAAPPKPKIAKRRSRASKRSPTTFITADPENFRQMVQQVTGVRFGSGQFPIGSVLKPEPQRVNRLQAGCLLPTLDTSAFLLEHHQQVAAPAAAEGFAPPCVVADGGGNGGGAGFDFDGFSCFPTLESWKVM